LSPYNNSVPSARDVILIAASNVQFASLQLLRPWCFTTPMRLITAHRILIATSIIFFFGFSFWQLSRHLQSGDGWALFQAAGYFLAAIGFAIYFMNIKRWYR
jgi:hypothetical protein